ncbi:MAG TPA: OmpA family protein [Bauldia sp.]|nr:OmpA family protein [Bauldia sp.]
MTEIRKTLLVTAAIVSAFAPPTFAVESGRAPVLMAQADTSTDAVAAAQAAVEQARTALRAAIAAGSGVDEAREALRQALQALEQARLAAGMPPSDPADLQPVLPEESAPATPPAETPPPAEQPPPADQVAPPAEVPPPPAEVVQPPAVEPPPAVAVPPVPPVKQRLPKPPANQAVPPVEPVVPPPADQVAPPPADQPVVPPAEQAPPSAEQQAPPPAATEAPAPVINLPPPVIEAPPPPPPPAATQQQGQFDLGKFKNRPKFGAVPPAAAAQEPPPTTLPKSEDAVKEGAVIPAQDGRVIVKEGGQVTVKHDDTGRFVQQGDKLATQQSANDTETTTVTRPDGTQIVTVRDKYGNIVQRYRKNKDGSVEVLIGDVQQPGIFGRILGQGNQPAPPRPRGPRPPVLNLNLGPIQLNIPRQQYIVESSRANEQQLQQTLMAPPVERVERTYTLEEIRQNGRLRDKVRRIDFDTITFDTGQATVPDDQIIKMQTIGDAIRQIIDRDPTQVFLIEGHTDAVGSDLSNLALSDRRAETVAEILSYYYGIPAENLVTQGYGEQFLKVPTTAANRENRRVAFRNITYLLRASAQ